MVCFFRRTLLQDILYDLQANKVKYTRDNYAKRKTSFWFISMINPMFGLVVSYRVYHKLYTSKNFLLKRIGVYLYYSACRRFSCDIHPASVIGAPLKIGHCSDIVVGPNVVIGSNCYILNGVSLGNKHVGGDNKMPTIEENVIIGTGSKILGDVRVGKNSTIGALTLVTNDVSAGKTVVGIPSRDI